MKSFDPRTDILNSQLILVDGEWPNFHDAEVHDLTIWRGDIRPADNVWIGPVIEATFELCALREPFIAVLAFRDCEAIGLMDFNHQNAVYDLSFAFFQRGHYNDGSPLPPGIAVTFEQAFGAALTFKCARVEVLARRALVGTGSSTELAQLLRALKPRLLPGEYVFCSVPPAVAAANTGLPALATFCEEEGVTLVLPRDSADAHGLEYTGAFRAITLGVESALDAVGLTAAVSTRLARRGISANVIAARHHDHVFVPAARAEEALVLLDDPGAWP